ncbi:MULTISPECIES: MgtC/SapB family protein [Paenibacillus]|uniref:MgtC/SapB family protein n=1 Tax=Paenibacillus radicis (ex Xue et al. 2023) TaxID=2972489 RepID=A0ABT1YJE0_9BACL|nr:MgtC/SapB family protein [Paenibacillus radicis (ex Xue et al. 2023)]MCR8633310.1 MgtC/SapB family protein [Paenibacillus radicis (ex Xue et al. 2023)]
MMYDVVFKLCMSLFLGFLIGIDRQLKHKPLGMKTSMVISVASCLITIVSIEAAHKYAISGQNNMDPLRLAAQIVSGVGFIGAGVILRRQNDVISGLTTAAMVWAASALGIASGAGFYFEASIAVILIIVAVNLFPMFIKLFGPNKLNERDLSLNVVVEHIDGMTALIEQLQSDSMRVKHSKVKDVADNHQQIELIISASSKIPITEIYHKIRHLQHVLTVEVENISA